VAAVRRGRDGERQIALLGDADQRDGGGHAGDQLLADRAAFVEHPHEAASLRLEALDGGERAVPAADLLVVAEDQEHRARRLEARLHELLDRLADADQLRLGVDRAAAPHEPAGHGAGEGRLLPVALGAGLDRHDVLVRHQHDGVLRGVATRPRVDERAFADELAVQGRVQRGIAAFEVVAERLEDGGIVLGRILVRHGRDADRRGEALQHGVFVAERDALRGRDRLAHRSQQQRARDERGREEEHAENEEQGEAFHGRASYRGSVGSGADVRGSAQ
jgi:hypothetical protein